MRKVLIILVLAALGAGVVKYLLSRNAEPTWHEA
jgi:hypothetical protein